MCATRLGVAAQVHDAVCISFDAGNGIDLQSVPFLVLEPEDSRKAPGAQTRSLHRGRSHALTPSRLVASEETSRLTQAPKDPRLSLDPEEPSRLLRPVVPDPAGLPLRAAWPCLIREPIRTGLMSQSSPARGPSHADRPKPDPARPLRRAACRALSVGPERS